MPMESSSRLAATLVSGLNGWDARRVEECLQRAGLVALVLDDEPPQAKTARVLVPSTQIEEARRVWKESGIAGPYSLAEPA